MGTTPEAPPTALDPVRLREMLTRAHLLGDLNTVEDVARELRIAAEETVGVGQLSLYLRRGPGESLVTLPGAAHGPGVDPLARRAVRDGRVLCAPATGRMEPRWAWPLVVGDRTIGAALASVAGEEEATLLGVLLEVAGHAFERALLLEARAAERRTAQQRASCLALVQDLIHLLCGPWQLGELLDAAVESVRDGLGYRLVLLRLHDGRAGGYVARASAGLPPDARRSCFERVVTREEIAPFFAPEFALGRSYFVSHRARMLEGREERVYVPDLGPRVEGEWHPQDVLLVPIAGRGAEPVGYLSVDDPADRLPPSQEVVGILEIFADLIALGLERNGCPEGKG